MPEDIKINDLGEAHRLRPKTIYTFHDAFVEFIKTTSNREISDDKKVSGGCNDGLSICGFNQGTKTKENKKNCYHNTIKEANNACGERILKEKINPLLQVREDVELFGSNDEKHSTLFKKRSKKKKGKQYRKYETQGSESYPGKFVLKNNKVCTYDTKFSQEAQDKRKNNISTNSMGGIDDSLLKSRNDVKETTPLFDGRESNELVESNVEIPRSITKKKKYNFGNLKNVLCNVKLSSTEINTCDNIVNQSTKKKKKADNSVNETNGPNKHFKNNFEKKQHRLLKRRDDESFGSYGEKFPILTKKTIAEDENNCPSFDRPKNVTPAIQFMNEDVSLREKKVGKGGSWIHSMLEGKISDLYKNIYSTSKKRKKHKEFKKASCSLALSKSRNLAIKRENDNSITINHSNEYQQMSLPHINKKQSQSMTKKPSYGYVLANRDNCRFNESLRKRGSMEDVFSNCIEKHDNIENMLGMLDESKTSKLSQIQRIVNAEEKKKSNSTARKKGKKALKCFETSKKFIDNTRLSRKESNIVIDLCEKFTDNAKIPVKEFEIDLNKSRLLDSFSDVNCICPRSNNRSFKNSVVPVQKRSNEDLTHKESSRGKMSEKDASTSKMTKIDSGDTGDNNEDVTDSCKTASLSENSDISDEINLSKSAQKRRIVNAENIQSISSAKKRRKTSLERFESSEKFIHNTGLPGKVSKTVIDLTMSPSSNLSSDVICISSPKRKDGLRLFKNNFENIKRICKKKTSDELLTNNESTETKINKKYANTKKEIKSYVRTDEIADNKCMSEVNTTSNEISCELQRMTSMGTSLQNKSSESNVSTGNISKIDMTFGNGTLDQDVLLSDDKLNNNALKFKREIECETKYDKRLKEVLSEKFISFQFRKKFFQDLHIVVGHEIPPLHQVSIFPNRGLNREERILLTKLGMREGQFSDSENSILMENWEKFNKAYNISDPILFVNLKKEFNRVKKEFLQFLGNRLPHRALHQIEQQFYWLCHTERGQYSEDEDKIILKVLEKKIQEPSYVLACVLKRYRTSIFNRMCRLRELKSVCVWHELNELFKNLPN